QPMPNGEEALFILLGRSPYVNRRARSAIARECGGRGAVGEQVENDRLVPAECAPQPKCRRTGPQSPRRDGRSCSTSQPYRATVPAGSAATSAMILLGG